MALADRRVSSSRDGQNMKRFGIVRPPDQACEVLMWPYFGGCPVSINGRLAVCLTCWPLFTDARRGVGSMLRRPRRPPPPSLPPWLACLLERNQKPRVALLGGSVGRRVGMGYEGMLQHPPSLHRRSPCPHLLPDIE